MTIAALTQIQMCIRITSVIILPATTTYLSSAMSHILISDKQSFISQQTSGLRFVLNVVVYMPDEVWACYVNVKREGR